MSAHSLERILRYQYIEPLLSGRRVLEYGARDGSGTSYLAERAGEVSAVEPQRSLAGTAWRARDNVQLFGDDWRERLAGERFDLILVPELERWPDPNSLAQELAPFCGTDGILVVATESLDSGDSGVEFDVLVEALETSFPYQRVFGEIPFQGRIIADFAPEDELEPTLDSSLVEEDDAPSHYLAMAGAAPVPSLPYTVVQLPNSFAFGESGALRVQLRELRDRLLESEQLNESLRERLESQKRIPATPTPNMAAIESHLERAQSRVRELEVQIEELRAAPARSAGAALAHDVGADVIGLRERLAASEQAVRDLREQIAREELRAEAAEGRCDQLVARIEQSAAEVSGYHRRIAELQAQRQAERWRVDELAARLRQIEQAEGSSSETVAVRSQPAVEADQRRTKELRARVEQEALRAGRAERRSRELESEVRRLRTEREKANAAEHSKNEELSLAERQELEGLRRGAALHIEESKRGEQRVAELRDYLSELRDQLAEAAQLRREFEERLAEKTAEAVRLTDEVARLAQTVAIAEGQLKRLQRDDAAAGSSAAS